MTRKEIALQITLKTLEYQAQRIPFVSLRAATGTAAIDEADKKNAQYILEFYKTIYDGLGVMNVD